MNKKPVIFIAFLEQDNLGVGYIASVLLSRKFDVKIIDFRMGKDAILEQVKRHDPSIIGFSIIFQYHIYDFKDLINYFRKQGVNCHFSAGGHYPSLRYAELLEIIPSLDSVVLFEGEWTFLELAQSINAGKEWKNIRGVAYRENNSITATPLRQLEKDLDNFPPPVRQTLREYALGKKYATILAGRGCYHNCSFCSIRQFYSKPQGALKRLRRPEMVVREMELLHRQLDCSIFMFQDDDFPVTPDKGKDWITRFCRLMSEKGLSSNVLWKINCRPDEVSIDLFRSMKKCGLFLVYLGIEDGTNAGLRLMNKRMKPEISINAVNILKQLNIKYDFGFMLFNPESTFQSTMDNLVFLEKICGDGSSPITFCKMLPYAATKIEHRLKKEGRLKGNPGFEDYDFIEASLNDFYRFITECFEEWIGRHDGLLNLARWTRYYLSVYHKYYPSTSVYMDLEEDVRNCISQSNMFFTRTVKELAIMFHSHRRYAPHFDKLEVVKNAVADKHSQFKLRLGELMERINIMGNLQDDHQSTEQAY